MQDAAPPMGERERERESCREAAGSFDLPLLASEASYGGLQDGTRAVVHCCLCGAGTQWNASSMVSHPSSRPPRRLRVRWDSGAEGEAGSEDITVVDMTSASLKTVRHSCGRGHTHTRRTCHTRSSSY